MSIFSSSTVTPSRSSKPEKRPLSILKKTTFKTKWKSSISHSKVRFVLPHSKRVHSILQDYVKNNQCGKDYENLVCLIRDSEITDDDISSLLREATECISLLNQDLRLFVEALFALEWITRSQSVINEYQTFIVNLLSAHNYHAKFVVDRLVSLFLPDQNDPEWPDGIPLDSDCIKCAHVHSLFKVLLNLVPICKELLINAVRRYFPYYNKPAHVYEYYLHNLLWILDYQPSFRNEIFHLIFSKLVLLDVNAPKEEILKPDDDEDEEIFEMELDSKSVRTHASTVFSCHAVGHTLDICLDRLFNYFISECHNPQTAELKWNETKKLYQDMLAVFDKIILPTYNTHHIQFTMFLICCFKSSLTEGFLNYLWKKVVNPNVAPVIRQAAANYTASLIARATFIPLSMLKGTLQEMSEWLHSYISTQDGLSCVNSDVRIHSVFYTVCQCLFYAVAFRHRDLVSKKTNLVFLESLNLAKIITCRLNPLRVCQPAVAQTFAAVTRKYQLAYCYSIMEHNVRSTLPVIYQNDKGAVLASDNVLNTFFPFDPYVLTRSAAKIQQFYREYQMGGDDSMEKTVEQENNLEMDDDFLYQNQQELPSSLNKHSTHEKFSYSCSPGFRH